MKNMPAIPNQRNISLGFLTTVFKTPPILFTTMWESAPPFPVLEIWRMDCGVKMQYPTAVESLRHKKKRSHVKAMFFQLKWLLSVVVSSAQRPKLLSVEEQLLLIQGSP